MHVYMYKSVYGSIISEVPLKSFLISSFQLHTLIQAVTPSHLCIKSVSLQVSTIKGCFYVNIGRVKFFDHFSNKSCSHSPLISTLFSLTERFHSSSRDNSPVAQTPKCINTQDGKRNCISGM